MKYVYFYSTLNTDFKNNYRFGRFGYTSDIYHPDSCAYSDDFIEWKDQTGIDKTVTVPSSWHLPFSSIELFLTDTTTYTANKPGEFRHKYPELLI